MRSPTRMIPRVRMSARTSPVDEWAQDRPRGVAVDDRAGLAQTHAAAADVADHELVADQSVDNDAAGHEVSAMVVKTERRVERIADFGFDQREGAAR